MFVTAEQLQDLGACYDALDRFVALFPDGVEVTVELCVRYASEFDFDWAACSLLNDDALARFRELVADAERRYEKRVGKLRHVPSTGSRCLGCEELDAAGDEFDRAHAEAFGRAATGVRTPVDAVGGDAS